MSEIRRQGPEAELEDPVLVEGFPGIGLVGKIATDHLIDQLDMRYYASVHCDGLPRIGIYRGGSTTIQPPVRLYVSEAEDVIALQSDVPISTQALESVAGCLTSWAVDHDATPVYLSGLPSQRDDPPKLFGVTTGDANAVDTYGIDSPTEDGVISGPTGALLNRAAELGTDSFGLVVECSPQFPDPEAASILLEDGICPIADVELDVEALIDRAGEIQEQRQAFAERMREVESAESTQAQPLRMYQ
ncbi:proteasome assembly chaperone family protein [Natronosalvus halobius]|uniref:proteasome assembly chaperone family protein n=1 Tax=Natronosalvus halobius TaxID=2953746 RepID=UPI0020A16D69|nr:PAC2 family protein [Natronosalvus halobius]USZ72679.1 PAC2 family protein [Natronosalvus halobius]